MEYETALRLLLALEQFYIMKIVYNGDIFSGRKNGNTIKPVGHECQSDVY